MLAPLLCIISAVFCVHVQLSTAADANHKYPARSVMLVSSHYRDFVPLVAANVSVALEDTQAWVLLMHSDMLSTAVKEEAAALRGLIRFGMFSNRDKDLIKLLKGFEPEKTIYRALSFGKNKSTKYLDTTVMTHAITFASNSVPDNNIIRIDASEDLEDLVTEAAVAKPSKISAVFLIRDKTPTLLHRVLSHKLSTYYNFGVITQADSKEKLQQLKLGDQADSLPVPGLFAILVKHGLKAEDISTAPYDDDTHGAINFVNVMRFLIEFNREVRHELVGDNRGTNKTFVLMTDVLEAEKIIFSVLDMADRQQKTDAKEELK